VRGTAAQPVILGRVNLSGGDIILNGDRFVLNGGTIEFVNPSETQRSSISPSTQPFSNTTSPLRFNGPSTSCAPTIPPIHHCRQLTSSTYCIWNNHGSKCELSLHAGHQAAESLVASQVSSQVHQQSLESKRASPQLSINPVLAGGTSQGPAGANITIQQRVTGNLFVTFSSNVASIPKPGFSAGRKTWNLQDSSGDSVALRSNELPVS